MPTFADQILAFNREVHYTGDLPDGIRILNPFRSNPEVLRISAAFYRKFYSDQQPRKLILGINPGRLGAGATGIPFTDSKRLKDPCGLEAGELQTHEPSSVFVYEVIEAMGGPEAFYRQFYINSVSPLGFVRRNKKGNWVNCNYYDFPELFAVVKPFILENLRIQAGFGVATSTCYALGKKNARFLEELNREAGLFGQILALDHPRYIVQYKSKEIPGYVAKYKRTLEQG
ncbi:SMUG2 DNA glycosylase family protein [Robiginitalea sp. SC105]|uniref:SMUG2 DNA glycosylase family protein n=1 Tax=Robiginitalea sp. SC105 TaxID=2762332 RepID=UPI00163B0B83|nr:SMUG2 DNA glycosylase family protein [Robiginitalea sp. SC105]MBC2839705.1 SMUG2 DNA glycosylase family protein [Robiginitalea sp. SC105]